MQKLRAARAAAEYIREHDPNSAITEYAIRTMMNNGDLPSITIGHKRLTSIEAIERLMSERLGAE